MTASLTTDAALPILASYAKRVKKPFTCDEFRTYCAAKDITPFEHPNAWSGLLTAAKRIGIIEQTGEHVRSTFAGCRHRFVTVWRATGVAA